MIGAPSVQSVLANQADTEHEAGIASDPQGRVCDFGPSHTECTFERTDYQAVFQHVINDENCFEPHCHFYITQAPIDSGLRKTMHRL
jgi:hypothetical protein